MIINNLTLPLVLTRFWKWPKKFSTLLTRLFLAERRAQARHDTKPDNGKTLNCSYSMYNSIHISMVHVRHTNPQVLGTGLGI